MARTTYTIVELRELIEEIGSGTPEWVTRTISLVKGWLERGDGVAVYENHDFGSPGLGDHQIVSYGSPAAQLVTDFPPERLPDIGNQINWRFTLVGTYRGGKLS
jgi:hypothetical protein